MYLRASNSDCTLIGVDRRQITGSYDFKVTADLADKRHYARIPLDSVQGVIHLAARSFVHDSVARHADYVRDNTLATSLLLSWAGSQSPDAHVILASSCEVYGDIEDATPDSPLRPKSPYAATKVSQEMLSYAAHHTFGLSVTICRFFNVFGHGQQRNRLIPQVIRALTHGDDLRVTGDGHQVRDWIHVRDLCESLTAILNSGSPDQVQILNIAARQPASVLQIAQIFENAFSAELTRIYLPSAAGHLNVSTSAKGPYSPPMLHQNMSLEEFAHSSARRGGLG